MTRSAPSSAKRRAPLRANRRLPLRVNRLPQRIRLAAAIEALPERDRLVLMLRLLEGLSVLETAGALRITVREVEQRSASSLVALARESGLRALMRRAA